MSNNNTITIDESCPQDVTFDKCDTRIAFDKPAGPIDSNGVAKLIVKIRQQCNIDSIYISIDSRVTLDMILLFDAVKRLSIKSRWLNDYTPINRFNDLNALFLGRTKFKRSLEPLSTLNGHELQIDLNANDVLDISRIGTPYLLRLINYNVEELDTSRISCMKRVELAHCGVKHVIISDLCQIHAKFTKCMKLNSIRTGNAQSIEFDSCGREATKALRHIDKIVSLTIRGNTHIDDLKIVKHDYIEKLVLNGNVRLNNCEQLNEYPRLKLLWIPTANKDLLKSLSINSRIVTNGRFCYRDKISIDVQGYYDMANSYEKRACLR